MPKYFFKAKSQKGKPYSSAQEASNKQELARNLRQEGYLLISADTKKTESPFSIYGVSGLLPFFGRVSLKDKIVLTRNLKVMISAGVSLPKALKTLSAQSKNKKLKKVLTQVLEQIIKGSNFSDALAEHPDVFSNLFYNMVKVGEESGGLEENLAILVRQMEREYRLKSEIKEAMMYPAVVISAMIGIGILMLIVVVPSLAKTFEELEIELPLTTKVVIGLGNFLSERWYLAALIAVLLFFLFRAGASRRRGRKIVDALLLRAPVVSTIIKKTNAAYTVRTLSSLISAGVPLVKSLAIVSETLSNFYFKEAIIQAIEKVRKGEKLSQALRPYQELYPLTVIQMVEVGEETGETSSILEKLGDFFEEEVTSATKNLTAVIEPVLMLIIGGAVGFFAVSMIQPMYSMLNALQ